MKIGIMVLSVGTFGKKGFYNLQEIGLAKALDSYFDKVNVYKLVPKSEKEITERIDGTKNCFISYMPSKCIGTNGIPEMNKIDTGLEALICFSDTQLMLPRVFRWTQRYNIPLFPYIGVVESHSNNLFKKTVIDILFRRNVSVYKKCQCLVKTSSVKDCLAKININSTTVVPVGLDIDLLHSETEEGCAPDLKKKYGYQKADKVILFIGRFIDEKQPVRMVDIFSKLISKDSSFRLLMVGKGDLKGAVDNRIKEFDLQDSVKIIESIPNSEIWELYKLADAFVNLNQQEIFGMAILEAMYYGCKVVAWHAPGPDMIIENGVNGVLCQSDLEVVEGVYKKAISHIDAKQRVINNFTWNASAKIVYSTIQK